MAIYVVGVVGIAIFYVVILIIGLWAGRAKGGNRRARQGEGAEESKEVMLAGRNIGLFVGAFTMTATWVGGGYINGTSEAVNNLGLVWAQSSWGYSLSLCFGGFLFAKIMRKRGYVTLLDPFQERYGTRIGGLMYIPAFLGELLWSAATLNSLGATISVVMNLDIKVSVIVSACIAIFYTFFGGLWSVAYTDVAQLICMFIGMWLTIPFAMTHKAVKPITSTSHTWVGKWDWQQSGVWIDYAFLLIFGGIPWQVYFQRVLSSKSHQRAQALSFAASFGCLIMSVPSILIGAIGFSTDWSKTGYDKIAPKVNGTIVIDKTMTMPLVLQYLTPNAVSFIGLGAVSAAVMSSVDSSVLSASSMFAHNIYKTIFRQTASEREIIWVIRVSVFVVGAIATVIGLTVKTIYGLSYLCSDLIYVILFPQLLCVLYYKYANSYGALAGYIVGFFLRMGGGEKLLGMEPLIKYPMYVGGREWQQRFPFRTFSMVITLIAILTASLGFYSLFQRKIIPKKYDYARCFGDDLKPIEWGHLFEPKGVQIDKQYEIVTMDGFEMGDRPVQL